MYSRNLFLERAQLALLDGVVVFVAFVVAALLRHGGTILAPSPGHHFSVAPYLFPATILAATTIVLLRYEGLYSRLCGRFAEAFRLARGVSGGTMAALALTFFYRGYFYSRATVLIFYPLPVLFLVAQR